MRLSKDNHTCIGKVKNKLSIALLLSIFYYYVLVNEIVLLFAQTNEIRGVNLEQPYYNTIPTLMSYDSQALLHVQINYLAADKKIYWSDYSSNEIKRSSLSGGNIEIILDTGISLFIFFKIKKLIKNKFLKEYLKPYLALLTHIILSGLLRLFIN